MSLKDFVSVSEEHRNKMFGQKRDGWMLISTYIQTGVDSLLSKFGLDKNTKEQPKGEKQKCQRG